MNKEQKKGLVNNPKKEDENLNREEEEAMKKRLEKLGYL